MKNLILILKYFFAYLFIGLAIGSYFPILSFYLTKELQLDGPKVGMILSFTTLIPIFILPLWGIVTDYVKSPKKTLLFALFFSSIMILILSFISNFYLFFIIIILFNLFRVPIFSLYDEILVDVCNEKKINYGLFRAACSLGVATSSLIGLSLANRFGNQMFFILSACFYFLAFLILIRARNVSPKAHERMELKKDFPLILKNKTFIIICLIWAITYGILDTNFSYMSGYINLISGSEQYIGLAILLSVFIEVFVLPFAKLVNYRLSLKTIILGVNLITILRYLIIFLFPSHITILILAPLHGITFGLTYPLIIQFIAKYIPKKVLSSAYTIYNALVALLTAVFSYLTGLIIDFNVLDIFILFIVLTLLNVLLISLFIKNKRMN